MKDEPRREKELFEENEISQRHARTYWEIVSKQFFKNKIAALGLFVVFLLFFVAIYAPFLSNDKPFMIHKHRPAEEYRDTWKSLQGFTLDLARFRRKVSEQHERTLRLSTLVKDYQETLKNQIKIDEICTRITKGEDTEALKKDIKKRRAQPLKIGDAEETKLGDVGASEELIGYLKNMDTKFDAISLDQVLDLMKKGLSLAEIKREISKRRINPFFYNFDKEDQIRATFKGAYAKNYKDSLKLEQEIEVFLTYLTKYTVDLEAQFKQVKGFKLSKFIEDQKFPVEKNLENFTKRAEELESYLALEKRTLVQTVLKDYTSLLKTIEKSKIPPKDKLETLGKNLQMLKPAWSREKEGTIQMSDIRPLTMYPAFVQLQGSDIFFMVLFLMVILAKIPFYVINKIRTDDFNKFFMKLLLLLLVPAGVSFAWSHYVTFKEDENDYRKMVQNMRPGDEAWIPPIFYNPTYQDGKDKFLPPSWLAPSNIGFQSLQQDGKRGNLITENFEAPSGEDVKFEQIKSPYLKPTQEEYKKLKKALDERLKKALEPVAKEWKIAYFLDAKGMVKSQYKNSKPFASLVEKELKIKDPKKIQTLRKGLETYEIKFLEEKNRLLALSQFSPLPELEKKLSQTRVVSNFDKYVRVQGIVIPKDRIIFFNTKEPTLEIFKNVIIEPGGTLILPASLQVEFRYQPPGFYWLDQNCQNLYNYHFFGTDILGRDIFSRMIWGARISLSVGFVAVGIYVMIGIFLGSLAGYFGGRTDMVISRMIEVMICFPTLVLIITVIAVMPKWIREIWSGMFAIMVVIGITGWTGVARLIRGEFLRLRGQDFVIAGRALGVSNLRLIFRHVVPNALAPVLVSATFGVAAAILTESGLSFLGLGVQPPTPTWGEMLAKARGKPLELWWLTIFPGLAIFVTVTVYNLVGEGVRDAIDPRLKER